LRQIAVVAAIALALVTVAVSGSLLVLTTSRHDASAILRDTVPGVRATREAQVDLLRHEHAPDAAERAQLASDLRRAVEDDSGYRARSSGADAAHEDAKRYVERYFATTLDARTSPAERSAWSASGHSERSFARCSRTVESTQAKGSTFTLLPPLAVVSSKSSAGLHG